MKTTFFNFHQNEYYIEKQCELLINVMNDAKTNDSDKNQDIISRYFIHAMAAWNGPFEKHPAQKILEIYISYLKDRGYKCAISGDGKIFLFTPNNIKMGKEILQSEDYDAIPISIALLSLGLRN